MNGQKQRYNDYSDQHDSIKSSIFFSLCFQVLGHAISGPLWPEKKTNFSPGFGRSLIASTLDPSYLACVWFCTQRTTLKYVLYSYTDIHLCCTSSGYIFDTETYSDLILITTK